MITSVYPSQIYTGEPLWVVDRAKKSAVQEKSGGPEWMSSQQSLGAIPLFTLVEVKTINDCYVYNIWL